MTISPSSTKRSALSLATASTISGKYRPSVWPLLERSSTCLPFLKTSARNPSHFGSYCQWSPEGISETSVDSIGAYVVGRGNFVMDRFLAALIHGAGYPATAV